MRSLVSGTFRITANAYFTNDVLSRVTHGDVRRGQRYDNFLAPPILSSVFYGCLSDKQPHADETLVEGQPNLRATTRWGHKGRLGFFEDPFPFHLLSPRSPRSLALAAGNAGLINGTACLWGPSSRVFFPSTKKPHADCADLERSLFIRSICVRK